jgi:hypothetical protein
MIVLEKGKKFRFKGQSEILVYIGHNWSGNGYWHQFTLDGKVWSEIQEQQFDLIESVV